jgi:hypothetical protein
MPETFRSRLLEVEIASEPPVWRWRVLAGDQELSSGIENAWIKASFAGYDAMFGILASGWTP